MLHRDRSREPERKYGLNMMPNGSSQKLQMEPKLTATNNQKLVCHPAIRTGRAHNTAIAVEARPRHCPILAFPFVARGAVQSGAVRGALPLSSPPGPIVHAPQVVSPQLQATHAPVASVVGYFTTCLM